MRWRTLLPALWALLLFAACSDDETPLPPYREDLLNVRTDAAGNVCELLRDDGARFAVRGSEAGLAPDTLYRAMAVYVEEGEAARLVSVARVLAPLPQAYGSPIQTTDPVGVEAVWTGGGHINLRLALKTGGLPQAFGFADGGIATEPGGHRRLALTLVHDQGADPQYYTRTAYVACPLYPYASLLTAGTDSVTLHVATYEGARTWSFAFPGLPS